MVCDWHVGAFLWSRLSQEGVVIPLTGLCPGEQQNEDPALFSHQKHILILAALIPRDERSLFQGQLCFSEQHPTHRAIQIVSLLKVTLPWLFLAGGGAGGARSFPAAAVHPFGITSLVVDSAWVNRLPSASALLAAKYLPALMPVCKARVLSSG